MRERFWLNGFRTALWILLALAVLAALASCSSDSDNGTGSDDDDEEDDDEDDDDDDDDEDDDEDDEEGVLAACDNPYCVFEREAIGADWQCDDPRTCIQDYMTFIERAEPYSNPISEDELDRQIDDLMSGKVQLVEDPVPEDLLRRIIIEATEIGFLYDHINERWLWAITVYKGETADYYERRILFVDYYVGMFKAILLVPKGKGPFPAVIGLHGHSDDAKVFREYYHGEDYPSHGYAILMPYKRALGVDEYEDQVTRDMLLKGFTFQGVQLYETLLCFKYLRYLPQIDDERIGLIGHSAGSVESNLTVRVEPDFAAYVSDNTGSYWNFIDDGGEILIQIETIPKLYPYNVQINDFSTVTTTPILTVPYGFEGYMDDIFAFFDEHLK